MADIEVRNNSAASRYEAVIGEKVAGYAEYHLDGDRIVFPHTVVEPEFSGQGVGSRLVKEALDDVRETSSRKVVPQCSFVRHWIEKHPEYTDLVADAR